jgi:hypothetical protein
LCFASSALAFKQFLYPLISATNEPADLLPGVFCFSKDKMVFYVNPNIKKSLKNLN